MLLNKKVVRKVFIGMWVALFGASCGGDGSEFGSQNAPAITSAISSSLPLAMKTGGLEVSNPRLSFPRASLNVPIGSDTVAPPPSSGNILWLVWNMDYNNYCTTDRLSSGECFRVRPSTYPGSGDTWNSYYKPAALTDSSICTTDGNYDQIIGTSVVSTACRFDYNIASSGTEVDNCYNSAGQDVDITEYVPWASDWGLPTTIKFQGSFGATAWANWFGLNRDVTQANGQDMITLSYQDNSGNMTAVHLDRVNNQIFYLSIGGKTTGTQGFQAYLGNLPTSGDQSSGAFEAIQVLDYNGEGSFGDAKFTIRMKSNGDYIWIQSWNNIPGDTGFDASNPNWSNDDECFKFESNLPSSIYVAKEECYAAFDKADKTAMDSDDNFTLKLGVASIDQSAWHGKGPELYNPDTNPIAPLGQCY